jgi:hypothetical protein
VSVKNENYNDKQKEKVRCIHNAGKTMDIYKCINIDISFIKKTKGEIYE